MTLKRPTRETVLNDIRERFRDGHSEATIERVKSIAERETDPVALRQLLGLVCEALLSTQSKTSRSGRPPAKKLAINAEGIIDLDATPPMTKREQQRYLRIVAQDHAIFEQVEKLLGKFNLTGAFRSVANSRGKGESEVRKAYYRIKNAHSPKL